MTTTWKPLDIPPDITKRGFYIGTSGYYFDDWIGLFNPPKQGGGTEHDRLAFYQKYFSFVEINNTFYREPSLTYFTDIERRSKESMMYSVKAYRDISHTKTWDPETGKDLMRKHLAAISPIVETGRFFSFLIQFEDHVYRSQQRLDYLLAVTAESVRKRIDVHVEFRHRSWHAEYVLQSMKDAGIGICNTEIPPVRHAFPLKSYATTDKGYIRYSGRNLRNWYPAKKAGNARERLEARNARYDYLYSDAEMEERVRSQLTLAAKVSSTAIAFNNHYEIKAVKNAIQNIRMLDRILSANPR